jgi:hypothetical protein
MKAILVLVVVVGGGKVGWLEKLRWEFSDSGGLV